MSLHDFTMGKQPAGVKPEKKSSVLSDAVMDTLSQAELLDLSAKIESRLIETKLRNIDVSKELLSQLIKAKQLQADAETDADAPLNQRAQAQNSTSNILKDLAKYQIDAYTSERFKKMETALIKTLKEYPAALQTAFYERYMTEAKLELT